MKLHARFFYAVFLSAVATAVSAQGEIKAASKKLELTTLTSSESERTALGVDFELKNIEVGFLDFSASGTYSFDDEVRSQDLMEFGFDYRLFTLGDCYADPVVSGGAPVDIQPGQVPAGSGPENRCPWGSWDIDANMAYETDQDFDDANTVFSLSAIGELPSGSDNEVLRQFYYLLDFVPGIIRSATDYQSGGEFTVGNHFQPVISLSAGEVNPKRDTERETLLGELEPYYRLTGEISITTPIAQIDGQPVVLAYDYRYFREVDADERIVDANRHRSRLLQFSLRMPSDNNRGYAFIGYASGKLPFGEDDKILEVGWSYGL
ncbi:MULTISPECIES: hypothetical protein [unclassified Microbulbifer]|uniref:hypothetical protein n=1 Tax=unclassified Microbulbifer TaxID=2619833 RepID=UPI0027E4D4D8|nr:MULTISPECIES: hypothetical protein [unclassified Microbulbifer]